MKWWRRTIAAVAVVTLVYPAGMLATALRSSSANYGINEDDITNGSGFGSASANYSELGIDDGGSSLGDSAVGNSASANYQSNSGFNTTAQPSLTFVINTTTVNLGTLSTSAKSTGTATFNVKDFSSYGYVVQVLGTAPTYGGHALTALTTDTASSAGTEQFGVNTVANSGAIGADPVQVPASGFSYGVAGDGVTGTFGTTRPYTIPDKWRFVSGETIASSPKTSGETDYTMTLMTNISALTPGGGYTGTLTLVATGTY